MAGQQNHITPVNIDQSLENVRIMRQVMEAEKGFKDLKACVLAAIDYFVQNYCKPNNLPNQEKNLTAAQEGEHGGPPGHTAAIGQLGQDNSG